MAIKTASVMIEGASLWCECGQFVSDPESGSSIIAANAYTGMLKPGQVVECEACGQKLRLPAVLGRLGVR